MCLIFISAKHAIRGSWTLRWISNLTNVESLCLADKKAEGGEKENRGGEKISKARETVTQEAKGKSRVAWVRWKEGAIF